MNVPSELKYSKDHEWIRVQGSTGTIGITDYAQGELGDVVFVELPPVGATLVQGKAFGTIEAVKAVSDLYAPVSGEVTEVNQKIRETPEAVNKDPYGDGWMIKVRLTNPGELSLLIGADGYSQLVGKH